MDQTRRRSAPTLSLSREFPFAVESDSFPIPNFNSGPCYFIPQDAVDSNTVPAFWKVSNGPSMAPGPETISLQLFLLFHTAASRTEALDLL
jgi:hypothetical protein